jgi:hypothetical protein
MPLHRRQFLRTTFGLGALLALRGTARAADTLAPAGKTPATPGLLFDAADLPRIRANLQRPEFREFWAYLTGLDFAAEEKFLNEEINFKNHVTDMSRAQVTMMRAAFMHLLYPDAKQLALARLAMHRLMGYPHWDWLRDSRQQPVSIMRGAGTCIGLAMVSEWLAADLTPAEQAAIANGMAVEGGPACLRGLHDMTHHDEVGEWSIYPDEQGLPPISVAHWPRILDETNLRITCTAGMAAAAACLQGRHPDVAKWIEATRASLHRYSAMLPKDGSFPEGVGYWDYTFTHYIFTLEVLRRKFGIDERATIDFPAQTQFALEMTLPTLALPDGCISIGDSGSAAGSVPLSWIAREYRDTTAQEMLLRPGGIRPAWTGAWTSIWYDPSVPAKLSASARLDRRQALGIVISRTGWTAQDSVVTLRSGGPTNHEHADRNSVIFAAHGERLFNDPMHASYSTKDPKWLLRQTEAHTAVLLDGQGHIYHDGRDGTNSSTARATIQDYRTGLNWMTVTSDASDAYRRAGLPAALVQRTLVYLKPDVLVIFDRVLLDAPLPVQARFQVYNDDHAGSVAADGRTFTITRPHATLHGWTATATDSTLAAGKLTLPEASGVYPFAEIRSAAAREHTLLTVCSAAPQNEAHGELTVTHAAGTWQISGTHRGQNVKVAIAVPDRLGAPTLTL